MQQAFIPFCADITPSTPAMMGGYYGRTAPSTEVDSTIETNGLIALEGHRIAWILIGIDALFGSPGLVEDLLKAFAQHGVTSIDAGKILIVATHTHQAPMLDETKPRLGICDKGWRMEVAERIAASVANNLNSQKPVTPKLHYGFGKADGAVYRRRNRIVRLMKRKPFLTRDCELLPNSVCDIPRDIRVLVLKQEDHVVAVIWSWACHPVASSNKDRIGSDFPGVIRDNIRQHLKIRDLPIIYFPGFSGDIRPNIVSRIAALRVYLRNPLYFGKRFKKPSSVEYAKFCDKLGTAVISTLERVWGVCETSDKPLRWNFAALPGLAREVDDSQVKLPLARFNIGAVPIICLGAEVSHGYAARLGYTADTPMFMTGCFDACFGYLPTASQIPWGGYEVDQSLPHFSLTGCPSLQIEENVVAAYKALEDVTC